MKQLALVLHLHDEVSAGHTTVRPRGCSTLCWQQHLQPLLEARLGPNRQEGLCAVLSVDILLGSCQHPSPKGLFSPGSFTKHSLRQWL